MKREEDSNKFLEMYKKNYKKLMIIPLILFLFSVYMLVSVSLSEGVPIYRDISLKGGLSSIVEIQSDLNSDELRNILESKEPTHTFRVSDLYNEGSKDGFIVDSSMVDETFLPLISEVLETDFVTGENYNSNYISPTLSAAFFKQALYILLISFVFMSLTIFLYFKKIIPSTAVVLSAIFDLVVTIGFLNLIKFEISVAGIGALLMLLGYSIDTDVLLTNRLIKEFGDNYFEKMTLAFKTGVLMSVTTLIAGLGALLVTNSEVIFEICFILVVGLIVDFISTWIQNSGLLLWWLEKEG